MMDAHDFAFDHFLSEYIKFDDERVLGTTIDLHKFAKGASTLELGPVSCHRETET